MNENQFGFVSSTDEAAYNKISKSLVIEDLINKNLSLSNYSENLNEIIFVYIALNPDTGFREENFKKYRRKNKVLEIGLNIDYYKLMQSEEQTVLQMLSSLYLQGIREYMDRKDFDNTKFYRDVKQLFEKHKLLKKETKYADTPSKPL